MTECAERLRSLANDYRLRIIRVLRGGPKNVGQIAQEIGLEVMLTSHHLKIMRKAEIVEGRRTGKNIVYRLHPDVYTEADCIDLGCCKLRLLGDSC
jgi:ArsR family transcriptional regulator